MTQSDTDPFFVFEITPSCNFECIYCYNGCRDNTENPEKQLNLTRIEKLFDKITSTNNIDSITIAGGEPLLHKDLFNVISYFKNKGIKTGIASNGSLLTEEVVSRLVTSGVSYFDVSLDTLDEEIHYKLTGNRDLGSIKKAITYIKKSPAVLTISTIISKLNLESIARVIDFSFAFSVDHLSLNRFTPSGIGEGNRELLQVEKIDLLNLLEMVENKSAQYHYPINISLPLENCLIPHKNFPSLNFGSCVCGVKKWVIDPMGNLRICEQNPEILGSLFDRDFQALSTMAAVLNFREDDFRGSCPSCEKYENCGGGCRFIRDR
ncbi:MAG: radical SAM protein [Spirochaetaceae bacterium]|jgi:radical SAM protein with 4Fe4S-binding SPASM domain|nr:radical SAM protein [Spirochaetaceae bacterium]